MPASVASDRRLHALLAADACLMTAATFSVAVGAQFAAFAALGSPKHDSIVMGVVTAVLMLAGAIAGPVLAWLLYGRPIRWVTVLGAVVGAGAVGPVAALLPVVPTVLGWPLKLFTDAELAGPIALLVLASAAFVALVAWLVVDTVRDLVPGVRVHLRLDAWRLAAVAVLVVLVSIVGVSAMRAPGSEIVDAVVFAMLAGVAGAGMAAGADLATWLWSRQGKPAAPAGA